VDAPAIRALYLMKESEAGETPPLMMAFALVFLNGYYAHLLVSASAIRPQARGRMNTRTGI